MVLWSQRFYPLSVWPDVVVPYFHHLPTMCPWLSHSHCNYIRINLPRFWSVYEDGEINAFSIIEVLLYCLQTTLRRGASIVSQHNRFEWRLSGPTSILRNNLSVFLNVTAPWNRCVWKCCIFHRSDFTSTSEVYNLWSRHHYMRENWNALCKWCRTNQVVKSLRDSNGLSFLPGTQTTLDTFIVISPIQQYRPND